MIGASWGADGHIDNLLLGVHNSHMKRTHIFLPEPMLKVLTALSQKTDISVAELIRRAIDAYLKGKP